ncbi:hypothetical protein Tco_0565072 [Tanacetum coccineum]
MAQKKKKNIIRVLHVFYLASGLKINIHKSNIYGIGVNEDEVYNMASNAGCIAVLKLLTLLFSKNSAGGCSLLQMIYGLKSLKLFMVMKVVLIIMAAVSRGNLIYLADCLKSSNDACLGLMVIALFQMDVSCSFLLRLDLGYLQKSTSKLKTGGSGPRVVVIGFSLRQKKPHIPGGEPPVFTFGMDFDDEYPHHPQTVTIEQEKTLAYSMPRDDPIIERIPRRSLKKRNITPSKTSFHIIGSSVDSKKHDCRFNIGICYEGQEMADFHYHAKRDSI